MMSFCYIDSPIGTLTLSCEDEWFTGLYMGTPSKRPDLSDWREAPHAKPLAEAARQLGQYFSGQRRKFELPLKFIGTEFQQRVWRALTEIPYGTTISYGELARRLGNPSASRAVGLANGKNPIAVIVPCHRVIGADGSLTGFGGGLPRKEWLLSHEGFPGMRSLQLDFGRPAPVRSSAASR
jgi:methylated-DNA-[protein]-cysteine S-methyltransferase